MHIPGTTPVGLRNDPTRRDQAAVDVSRHRATGLRTRDEGMELAVVQTFVVFVRGNRSVDGESFFHSQCFWGMKTDRKGGGTLMRMRRRRSGSVRSRTVLAIRRQYAPLALDLFHLRYRRRWCPYPESLLLSQRFCRGKAGV